MQLSSAQKRQLRTRKAIQWEEEHPTYSTKEINDNDLDVVICTRTLKSFCQQMLKRKMDDDEDARIKHSPENDDKKRPCISLDMNAVNSLPLGPKHSDHDSADTDSNQSNSPIGENLTVKIPCPMPPEPGPVPREQHDRSTDMRIVKGLIQQVCENFFFGRRRTRTASHSPKTPGSSNTSSADRSPIFPLPKKPASPSQKLSLPDRTMDLSSCSMGSMSSPGTPSEVDSDENFLSETGILLDEPTGNAAQSQPAGGLPHDNGQEEGILHNSEGLGSPPPPPPQQQKHPKSGHGHVMQNASSDQNALI
mmetsp:Transcript_15191/g.23062  ORF Transcript_15191/g.23062 Transcript_15191/m.23062 type:complete len:307 (-) Transcript_15191:217-1137(-)